MGGRRSAEGRARPPFSPLLRRRRFHLHLHFLRSRRRCDEEDSAAAAACTATPALGGRAFSGWRSVPRVGARAPCPETRGGRATRGQTPKTEKPEKKKKKRKKLLRLLLLLWRLSRRTAPGRPWEARGSDPGCARRGASGGAARAEIWRRKGKSAASCFFSPIFFLFFSF